MPQAHCIETLSWELRFADARLAAERQEQLSHFLRRHALARLELGFERHAPAPGVWRLDRLELNLGRLSLRDGPLRWERQLDAALEAALDRALGRAAGPSSSADDDAARPGPQRLSGSRHELTLFLHYLQHGHLPWGVPLRSGRDMAAWLERLARRQGLRLWQALQLLLPPGPALQRLTQIAPHQGLQALLQARHPELAGALEQIDQLWLVPLQQRGRLSAYQVARLQQSMRAAGLRALWGLSSGRLSGARQRSLMAGLMEAHQELLGSGWTALRQELAPSVPPVTARRGSELAQALLACLVGRQAAAPGRRSMGAIEPAASASPTWDAALAQLREGLHGGKASPALRERLAQLIRMLAASRPRALREALRLWVRQRSARRQWSERLDPATLWTVLGLLSQNRQDLAPGAGAGTAAASWLGSLDQTSLRLLGRCPAAQRPGLSQLRALLLEACLQHAAQGKRLPDSHGAWLLLWERAWAGWLGDAPAAAQDLPGRGASPGTSTTDMLRRTGRSAPPPAADPPPWPAAPPAHELRLLGQDCAAGRWGWPQRLRLARLLESPAACECWLEEFDTPTRWQMLRAQFGPAMDAMRRRAERLLDWSAAMLALGRATAQARLDGERRHWRLLCRQLFQLALGPDPARLRRDHMLALAQDGPGGATQQSPAAPLPRPDPPAPHPASRRVRQHPDELQSGAPRPGTRARPAPAGPTAWSEPAGSIEPIWVGDAGQVLLAAFAERLFEQQGLAVRGRFVDARARARGVRCLQALAHGRLNTSEPEWVLSKLLCGVQPAELLPDCEPLEAATHELLEGLLSAVITHWKALGGTSIAGLRESFLCREGRLQRQRSGADDSHWRLQVKPRAFDMLLDRLPWGFSTIKLPWMTGVLHVDWR